MNFPATLKPVFLAGLLLQVASAGPLEDYLGANRLILVSMPKGSSTDKTAAALVTHRAKIEERDLKVIDVSEGTHRIPAAVRLPAGQTNPLRKQFKLESGNKQPIFILIGKDGGEMARQTGDLNLEKWFVLIDGMPMRKQEIKDKAGAAQ